MSRLEKHLSRIVAGEYHYLFATLRSLVAERLFISVDADANADGSSVHIPTTYLRERDHVPVFSRKSYARSWAASGQRVISLIGAEIAASVPADAWVMVNPGKPTEVQLTPAEVAKMGRLVSESASTANEQPALSGDSSGDELLDELETLLLQYAEVQEAFYQSSDSQYSAGLLGVLASEFSSERRFNLVSDIAELARRKFGTAGAIEVYDDLANEASSSWELFSTLTPFYLAGTARAERGGAGRKVTPLFPSLRI